MGSRQELRRFGEGSSTRRRCGEGAVCCGPNPHPATPHTCSGLDVSTRPDVAAPARRAAARAMAPVGGAGPSPARQWQRQMLKCCPDCPSEHTHTSSGKGNGRAHQWPTCPFPPDPSPSNPSLLPPRSPLPPSPIRSPGLSPLPPPLASSRWSSACLTARIAHSATCTMTRCGPEGECGEYSLVNIVWGRKC